MTLVIRNTNRQVYDPPMLPPYPRGLYAHVDWVEDGAAARFLLEDGVVIRPANFNAEIGAWDYGWCADPDSIQAADAKAAERAAFDESSPFRHDTAWAADRAFKGNLRDEERQRTRDRARQNLERLEQLVAERLLAERMLADIAAQSIPVISAVSVKDAVGQLEDAAALTGVGGLLMHARPYWAVQEFGLFDADFKTVIGTELVVGGGYVETLENRIVLTSPIVGWRTGTEEHEALKLEYNQFVAVAERSVLLGYEKIVAVAEIS